MNKKFDGDPLAVVRRSDPVEPDQLPTDTSGLHAQMLFEKITSSDPLERPATERPIRSRAPRLAIGMGSAVVLVAAVVGVSVALRGGSGVDNIVGGVPIASPAMCVETYSLEALANRDIAFDGTLTSIDGSDVTFEVNAWFIGGKGDSVTLDAAGAVGGVTPISGESEPFQIGSRYLVSGSDGFVTACGFTMTYDTGIAAQWAEVFGS